MSARASWVVAGAAVAIAVLTILVVPVYLNSDGTPTWGTSSGQPPPYDFPGAIDVPGHPSPTPILPDSGGLALAMGSEGVVLLLAAAALLWFGCMLRVLTKADNYRNGTQLVWVLVLLLAGPVGAVLFLLVGAGNHDTEKPLRTRAEVNR